MNLGARRTRPGITAYPLGVLAGFGPLFAWLFIAHHLGMGDSWPEWLRFWMWIVLMVGPAIFVSWLRMRDDARRAAG